MMNNEIIICECNSADHQWLIRSVDDDDDFVYIHVFLSKRKLFHRIKYAVKYIFGYKSRYGAWDEIILGRDHAEQFQRLAEKLKTLP